MLAFPFPLLLFLRLSTCRQGELTVLDICTRAITAKSTRAPENVHKFSRPPPPPTVNPLVNTPPTGMMAGAKPCRPRLLPPAAKEEY